MSFSPKVTSEMSALDALETFGLSAYAAETYLALAENGTLTAREVSDVTDVPRTRVYDAIDELEELGIVKTEEGSPKEFTSLDLRRTSRRLGKEYDRRAAMLTLALLDVDDIRSRTTPIESDAVSADDNVDFEELIETIQHRLSEVRLFTLTSGDGDELTAVYLPGDDGEDPELRLLSNFAEGYSDD